eukprot:GEMP01018685.1.p1 GENE.GEMP01018685.1~~GEMP01018685.1.p1  ORF type:complete len:200 (+),score=34.96 GEMP01018685.1:264-863(+)
MNTKNTNMFRKRTDETVSLTFSLTVSPYNRKKRNAIVDADLRRPKGSACHRFTIGGSGGSWLNQKLDRSGGAPNRKSALDDIARTDVTLSCFGKKAESSASAQYLMTTTSVDIEDLDQFYRPFSSVTLWDYISKYLHKAGEAYARFAEDDVFGDNGSLISEMPDEASVLEYQRSSSSAGSDWCMIDGRPTVPVEDWLAI